LLDTDFGRFQVVKTTFDYKAIYIISIGQMPFLPPTLENDDLLLSGDNSY